MVYYNHVDSVQFGLLSTDEILRMSVVEVATPETMRNDGRPAQNGVLDPRMGLDHHGACATCNQLPLECNGHFGHIRMPIDFPVYNMVYRATICKLLNTLCIHCGRLPVAEAAAERAAASGGVTARLGALHKLCAMPRECIVCGKVRAVVSWQGFKLTRAASAEAPACVESPARVYRLLDEMPASIVVLLGFASKSNKNHPRDLMNLVIPVIPVCARPGVVIDDYRAEDDISVKYIDVVKTKLALTDAIASGHPGHVLEDLHGQLQMHWATLQRNDVGASVTRGGRLTKSIYDRNTGKTGRMRVNVQGKRVNNSARTVISGDPNLQINEVGMPMSIASILSVDEMVNDINIERMQALLDDDRVNFVHKNGRVYDIAVKRRCGQRLKLVPGDRVERHVQNGDWVLFNRQPTLHRQGLMAMRARVLPAGSTLRMNLAVTTGYNADFDGDEMNCFMPGGVEARAEAATLMSSEKHIISAASSKPVIAIIQDSLLNSSVMSRDDIWFDRGDFYQLCCQLRVFPETIPAPARLHPPRWSGKQALSLCLPRALCARSGDCVFDRGQLISGTYGKKALGASRGGLVHVLFLHFGDEAVARFLDDQQQISNEFAMQYGASVGLGDAIVHSSVTDELARTIECTRGKIRSLIASVALKDGDALPVRVETRVNALLNACRDDAGHIARRALDPRWNNLLKMIDSGSKGSLINIAQISGCVGQQNVEGARVAPQFDGRALPHFKRGDFSDRARGFVEHSYIQGLDPAECFFHAKAGREGLCDTALRTSESGYMQRRCIKALEDVRVEFDGTVRDGDGRVVQFVYGEDNCDATRLEKHSLDPWSAAVFEWTAQELADTSTAPVKPEALEELRREARALREDAEILDSARARRRDTMLPLDARAYVRAVSRRREASREDEPPLPWSIAYMTRELVSRLERAPGGLSIAARYHVRARLASKPLLRAFPDGNAPLTLEVLGIALREIELGYARARVQAGEAVGIIAAQSLGEPLTQSTLNTFHFTGVSSMRATTQGLPRFRELLGATEHPQTPMITAPLVPGADVRRVQRSLDHIAVGDLVVSIEWLDDAPTTDDCGESASSALDVTWLPPEAVSINPSACVRVELNRSMLRVRTFATEDGTAVDPACYIAWRIERALGVYCDADDSNAERPCVRVRAYAGSPLNASPALLERAILGVDVLGKEGLTDVRRVAQDGADDGAVVLEMLGVPILRVIGEEGVDGRRVLSNHVREVWRVLGIEAARATLVREMTSTIEGGGSGIDVRHVVLVADVMTLSGEVTAVSRYGTNKSGRGPITRSSFEQTVEVLADAALTHARDAIGGVSDKIFLGQRIRVGSGSVDCIIDTNAYGFDCEPDEFGDDMFEAEQLVANRSFDPFDDILTSNPFQRGRTPAWSPDREEHSPPPWEAFDRDGPGYYSPTSPTREPQVAYSPTSPAYSPSPSENGDDVYEPGHHHTYEPGGIPSGMIRADDLLFLSDDAV